MHDVAALGPQAAQDDVRLLLRRQPPAVEPITHDLSNVLDVQCAAVYRNAGTASGLAILVHGTKTPDHIRFAVAVRVSQGHDVTARSVLKISVRTAPGVHVNIPVGSDREMSSAPKVVGEHRRAETWWKHKTAIALVAALALFGGGLLRVDLRPPLRRHCDGTRKQDHETKKCQR